MDLARKLRAKGFHVEIDSSGSSFSKQFKRANRIKATWAIVIGEDEVSHGRLLLKKLKKDEDKGKPIERFIAFNDLDELQSILIS